MKLTSLLAAVSIAALGCASVEMKGYGDGWVKTSAVSYHFVGPPLLGNDVNGSTYYVQMEGVQAPETFSIDAFAKRGMHEAADQRSADLTVYLKFGNVGQTEPTAGKLGKKWYPGFQVNVPYTISVTQGRRTVIQREANYNNLLTFSQFPGFETEEEAIGALDMVRKLGKDGVEQKARAGAIAHARKNSSKLCQRLFEERNISMDVPVVRKAAGVDLEEGYTLLSNAENPDQVRQALAVYQRMGTNQIKEDGTPNGTANYGIWCGIAACKLMLRDLSGAWEAGKEALEYEPDGDEIQAILRVIYDQEKITGERVIPEEERAKIDSQMEMAEKWQKLFENFD